MVINYGIDPTRVYVTGISNGGFMSVRLALALSQKITAVVPVAAQLSVALKHQSPQQPISIMILNGTEDPIVPFNGGQVRLFSVGRNRGVILSVFATIEQFRLHNGCVSIPKLIRLPDSVSEDGTTVAIETLNRIKITTPGQQDHSNLLLQLLA